MSDVAVLVPRRSDGGRRDRLWEWVRDRWEREHPAWKVIEGYHDDGPFNRSAAINSARSKTDAEVLVVADADTFIAAGQAAKAVSTAKRTGQMTIAFDLYCYLGRSMSDRVMDGFSGDWMPGVEFTMQGTCSCAVMVSASLFDECRGFDEGFVGWGGEDVAFSLAAQTFGGGLQRIRGSVWHLWHAPAPRDGSTPWARRMQMYADAAYDAPAMRRLLDEIKDDPEAHR